MMKNPFQTIVFLLCLSGIVLVAAAAEPGAEQPSDLTISLAVVQPKVPFGGGLKVEVTLSNRGKEAIVIPPGVLRLAPDGWDAWGRGGTGLGNDVRLPAEDAKAGLTVPAGSKATVEFIDREFTVVSLGSMTCGWRPMTEDTKLQPLLGKPKPMQVRFEVVPSQLMESAWAARTEEDRARLLPEVRQLLILRANRVDWRQRRLVEGTFKYLAGSALPLLDQLAKDSDPLVRAQAIEEYRYSAWAVGNMQALKNAAKEAATRRESDAGVGEWMKQVPPADSQAAEEACVRTALAGLKDPDATVRVSAVNVLTWGKHGPAEEVKQLASDPAPSVRAAVQGYLALFAGSAWAADTLIASLKDPNEEVRAKAVMALETSPEPPPLEALKTGFAAAKGQAAIPMLSLLYEQEDKDLPATLLKGFADRREEEKLAILASVAGHADDATLDIARLALADKSASVQRQGLLRLLPFAQAKVQGMLADYVKQCPAGLKPLAQAVSREIQKREIFPFLTNAFGPMAAATEKEFPSRNGTVPMVSPDGKRVAYVETGWGRPGGSGGMGRSNLMSLVHVVDKDGKNDRIVSDLFLVAWTSDSRHVGSSRDGQAAVTDIEGNIVTEFGTPTGVAASKPGNEWTQGNLRQQFGGGMPLTRRIEAGGLEEAAFSPDGKWLGPLKVGQETLFLNADGQTVKIPEMERPARQAMWSPDGKHVLAWNWGWGGKYVAVIDFKTRKVTRIEPVDLLAQMESWEYRKCRWNPWSRDGSHLAFLRDGQVWMCKPDGQDASQLTWGARAKAFPTFSSDGKQVAYLCYQPDNRLHYHRLGPTDLWVVDLGTGMETRITKPDPGRTNCLDWLDGRTLVFDRLDPKDPFHASSTLRTVALGR